MFRNSVLRLCKLLGNQGGGRRLISGCLCGFECFALLLNHSPSLLHGLPGKKQTTAVPQGKAVELRGRDWLRENTQAEQEGGFSPQSRYTRRKLNPVTKLRKILHKFPQHQ